MLEVNNTCSLAPSSYFQISVETVGSSKKAVIAEILHEAEAIAAAEGAATVTAGSDTAYIYSSTTASTAFATNNVHTTNATTTTTTTNAPSLLHREPSAVSESEHAQGEAALVMG